MLVDALRASATAAAMLEAGAEEVWAVRSKPDAAQLATEIPDAVLCGERGGRKIPGYHLGNSPTEILASHLRRARVVMTTSNMSRILLPLVRRGWRVVLGSVVNLSAACRAVDEIAQGEEDLVCLIPAGDAQRLNRVAWEDWASCALLWEALVQRGAAPVASAVVERWLDKVRKQGLVSLFERSHHGKHLAEIGYAQDVQFCSQLDRFSAVPALTGTRTLGPRRLAVLLKAWKG